MKDFILKVIVGTFIFVIIVGSIGYLTSERRVCRQEHLADLKANDAKAEEGPFDLTKTLQGLVRIDEKLERCISNAQKRGIIFW